MCNILHIQKDRQKSVILDCIPYDDNLSSQHKYDYAIDEESSTEDEDVDDWSLLSDAGGRGNVLPQSSDDER